MGGGDGTQILVFFVCFFCHFVMAGILYILLCATVVSYKQTKQDDVSTKDFETY